MKQYHHPVRETPRPNVEGDLMSNAEFSPVIELEELEAKVFNNLRMRDIAAWVYEDTLADLGKLDPSSRMILITKIIDAIRVHIKDFAILECRDREGRRGKEGRSREVHLTSFPSTATSTIVCSNLAWSDENSAEKTTQGASLLKGPDDTTSVLPDSKHHEDVHEHIGFNRCAEIEPLDDISPLEEGNPRNETSGDETSSDKASANEGYASQMPPSTSTTSDVATAQGEDDLLHQLMDYTTRQFNGSFAEIQLLEAFAKTSVAICLEAILNKAAAIRQAAGQDDRGSSQDGRGDLGYGSKPGSESSGRSCGSNNGGGQSPTDPGENGSGSGGNDLPPPRVRYELPQTQTNNSPLLFSCPFRKRNPKRFNVRDYESCALREFTTFTLVK
jgi:hypothetical protein